MEVLIPIMLLESRFVWFSFIVSGVESALSKTSNKFESWRKILENGDTARDEKFASLNRSKIHFSLIRNTKGLPKDIEKLTRDVRNVEKTVIHVEENPAKYSHIDAVGCVCLHFS